MIAALAGIGIALCAFLLALMAAKRRKALGDTWLMVWLGVHALFFASIALAERSAGLAGLAASMAGQIAVLCLPPVQLVYVWRATTGEIRPALVRSAWILIGVGAVLALPFLVSIRSASGAIIADGPVWMLVVPPLAMLGTLYYPLAARRRLTSYRRALKQRLSNMHAADLGWARLWTSSALALLLVQFIVFAVSLSGLVALGLHVSVLLAAQIAQIAYVGFHGLTQSRVFGVAARRPDADEAPDSAALAQARTDFEAVLTFLRNTKAHEDENLGAGRLAELVGWAPDRLSRALRLGGGSSFNDVINAQRVEAFKALARAPENRHVSTLALAHDAGFGSKSAFYAAFRTAESMSPASWRKSITN